MQGVVNQTTNTNDLGHRRLSPLSCHHLSDLSSPNRCLGSPVFCLPSSPIQQAKPHVSLSRRLLDLRLEEIYLKEVQFGTRVEKRKKGLEPIRDLNLDEYLAYREAKLNQLKPLVLDDASGLAQVEDAKAKEVKENEGNDGSLSERVAPKNPRWVVYGKGLEDVTEFFNSEQYEPGAKKSEGPRKLFTKEEKAMPNKRKPDIAAATSVAKVVNKITNVRSRRL